MNRRWLLNKTNSEFIQHIARTASVSPVFARVLVNRGLKSAAHIADFLKPGITQLSDPFGIDGVSAAVKRIHAALKGNERIFVHGDYDADGISATAIVYHTLKRRGADCLYFIPERFSHGYGFHPYGVRKAKESGASLIITVDCGITSFEAVAAAKKEGIDVIITDHHEPAKGVSHNGIGEVQLPDAYAVINPKISDQGTAVENLAGAGVALKLMQALCGCNDPDMPPLFDLATLGTIADVVPLTEENRVIVRNGLSLINKGERPWMRALMKVAGVEGKDIRAQRLAYSVIPRINAAGRLASSEDVVKLLTTDSEDEAWEFAVWLDRLNAERQRIEEGILQEALKKLDGKDVPSAVVLSGRGWHEGVIGIVASRVAEKFSRPTVIFSVEGGIAKGSARSVPAFDICRALSDCSDLLISYGGHKQAAGVKLNDSNLRDFERRLRCLCDTVETGKPADLTIDADVSLSEMNFGLIRELNMLEPLGLGNPEPLFGGRMLDVLSPRIVGSRHVRMKLCQRSYCVDTIGFDMGGFIDKLDLYETVDAVFTPTVNEWNGGRNIQLVLRAFRPSSCVSSSES
ncbi:MAG TPA: single-stranded-DNA-specific exonuclease RecJ [Candidatus Sulfobium mesophilum]|nr:single-stranded-DNA-specific exonuclease RecJ [Candidatus Sulfobium mesophilum]